MRKAALLQFDLFVTTISDAAGLQCFIYPQSLTEFFPLLPVSKWPEAIERMLPDYLQGKIIIEINNGQQIFFKICEYCFEQLSQTTGFLCAPCYEKNSKAYN